MTEILLEMNQNKHHSQQKDTIVYNAKGYLFNELENILIIMQLKCLFFLKV